MCNNPLGSKNVQKSNHIFKCIPKTAYNPYKYKKMSKNQLMSKKYVTKSKINLNLFNLVQKMWKIKNFHKMFIVKKICKNPIIYKKYVSFIDNKYYNLIIFIR